MKKLISFICIGIIFLCITGIGSADDTNSADTSYTVSGIISFPKSGAINIQLLDENGYEIGMGKRIHIIPTTKDIDKGFVEFCFTDIPSGIYAIRCYQDVNNNGVMDTGLFGIPVEPCNTYKKNPYLGAPQFENICFSVRYNISGIRIEL